MPLHLFEACGVELEYMIVDADTLDVRPICDRLMQAQTGTITGDVDFDDGIGWTNELVAHVVELKTVRPWRDLAALGPLLREHVQRVNGLLEPMNARLMPGAMHPWMDPHRESVLWPHESSEIYQTFHRIFDCRGHGWSNLQSMHLNLPFAGDEEFGRLHAAVRLLLPILPALAASSPIVDGRVTGIADNRLAVYQTNCRRVPSVTGRVVPEPVYTRTDYEHTIFQCIFSDLAPHDPAGVLRDEFANARGAIARFGRGSIEIRVIDVQECPAADLAVAAATFETLKLIAAETWLPLAEQQAFAVDPLADLFDACLHKAEKAVLTDAVYLRALGFPGARCTAGELWAHLVEQIDARAPGRLDFCRDALGTILRRGTLSTRLRGAVGDASERDNLAAAYEWLCICAGRDTLFT